MTIDAGELHWMELGADAAGYLSQRLRDGNRLAHHLARIHDPARGDVSTRLPAGVSPAAARDFGAGGKLPPAGPVRVGRAPGGSTHAMVPVPALDADLAAFVRPWLLGGAHRVFLVENLLARAGDPWLARARSRVLLHGAEVYHAVCPGDAADAVECALREGKSVPEFVGVLSTLEGSCPETGASISDDALNGIARRAWAVIVGAYDGESYLLWRTGAE